MSFSIEFGYILGPFWFYFMFFRDLFFDNVLDGLFLICIRHWSKTDPIVLTATNESRSLPDIFCIDFDWLILVAFRLHFGRKLVPFCKAVGSIFKNSILWLPSFFLHFSNSHFSFYSFTLSNSQIPVLFRKSPISSFQIPFPNVPFAIFNVPTFNFSSFQLLEEIKATNEENY